MKTKITFNFEDWCRLCDALECSPDMGIDASIIKAKHFNKRSRHTPKLLKACQVMLEIWDAYINAQMLDPYWLMDDLRVPIEQLKEIVSKILEEGK